MVSVGLFFRRLQCGRKDPAMNHRPLAGYLAATICFLTVSDTSFAFESSKLSSGVVTEGSAAQSPKLTPGVVIEGTGLQSPKLSPGAVVDFAGLHSSKLSVGIVVESVSSGGLIQHAPLTHW